MKILFYLTLIFTVSFGLFVGDKTGNVGLFLLIFVMGTLLCAYFGKKGKIIQ